MKSLSRGHNALETRKGSQEKARQNKAWMESRAGGGETSKLASLGKSSHSSSFQCGQGFSSSRAALLGVCPQRVCHQLMSSYGRWGQMPQLGEAAPQCSGTPTRGRAKQGRTGVVGECQVGSSFPAPVPVARGGTDGAGVLGKTARTSLTPAKRQVLKGGRSVLGCWFYFLLI